MLNYFNECLIVSNISDIKQFLKSIDDFDGLEDFDLVLYSMFVVLDWELSKSFTVRSLEWLFGALVKFTQGSVVRYNIDSFDVSDYSFSSKYLSSSNVENILFGHIYSRKKLLFSKNGDFYREFNQRLYPMVYNSKLQFVNLGLEALEEMTSINESNYKLASEVMISIYGESYYLEPGLDTEGDSLKHAILDARRRYLTLLMEADNFSFFNSMIDFEIFKVDFLRKDYQSIVYKLKDHIRFKLFKDGVDVIEWIRRSSKSRNSFLVEFIELTEGLVLNQSVKSNYQSEYFSNIIRKWFEEGKYNWIPGTNSFQN